DAARTGRGAAATSNAPEPRIFNACRRVREDGLSDGLNFLRDITVQRIVGFRCQLTVTEPSRELVSKFVIARSCRREEADSSANPHASASLPRQLRIIKTLRVNGAMALTGKAVARTNTNHSSKLRNRARRSPRARCAARSFP